VQKDADIIIAEDDNGHAALIIKNLKRAGIENRIIHFGDGEETLNFFFMKGEGPHREKGRGYLLLLDIRMPRVDGLEVLLRIKEDEELRKIPVIIITTTDDPKDVDYCYKLGCSNYITKSVDYEKFIETSRHLGQFLLSLEIPTIDGNRHYTHEI